MQVDLTDKRTASEIVSSADRIGILHPRTSISNPERTSASIVPKSPFTSIPKLAITKTIIPDTILSLVEAFPFGSVSGGVLEVTGLGINVQSPKDDAKIASEAKISYQIINSGAEGGYQASHRICNRPAYTISECYTCQRKNKSNAGNFKCIAAYLSHSEFDWNYFLDIFNDIESLIIETIDKRYGLVLTGDFNLILDHGRRGDIMK